MTTYTVYAYENGRNTDSAAADLIRTDVPFKAMERLVIDLKNAGYAVVVMEN